MHRKKGSSLIDDFINNEEDLIIEKIADYCSNMSHYVTDQGDDVSNLTIDEINLKKYDDIEYDLLELEIENDKRELRAIVNLEVALAITGNASINDYDNGIYDKEDGKYLYVPTVEINIDSEVMVSVQLVIDIEYENRIDSSDNDIIAKNISVIHVNNDEEITIYFSEDYYY